MSHHHHHAERGAAGGDGDGEHGPLAEAPRRPWLRRVVLAPVFAYPRWISPGLAPSCRFEPSCSAYAVQVVDRFGILRGLALAIWRVARCNPLGGSGLDRAEDQRIFPLFSRTKRQAK
jgi:hypothetical protein